MTDPDFTGYDVRLSDPATRLHTVVPSDASLLPWPARALTCIGEGTVRVTSIDDDTADFWLGAGGVLPVQVKKVWQTGTTATGIVALA